MIQYITRKGHCDSAHRVMNQRFKCYNFHSHLYLYELEFAFDTIEELGYSLDFGEIKRIAIDFIDVFFDHGAVLNPKDEAFIEACKKTKSKYWLMSLNGEEEYCNPSAENMSKELFLAIDYLFSKLPTSKYFKLNKVILYETPNCYTTCTKEAITEEERVNFLQVRGSLLKVFSESKGFLEYDNRKY